MQDIRIESTSSTPQVVFLSAGNLLLKGRSLIMNVNTFYKPLMEWIAWLDVAHVKFTIDFDYFNSASSKVILEMLKLIDCNNNVKDFDVFWHFEKDDDDVLEIGQIYEEKLRKARFYFKEFAESA
jgi:hypothetical protein